MERIDIKTVNDNMSWTGNRIYKNLLRMIALEDHRDEIVNEDILPILGDFRMGPQEDTFLIYLINKIRTGIP